MPFSFNKYVLSTVEALLNVLSTSEEDTQNTCPLELKFQWKRQTMGK